MRILGKLDAQCDRLEQYISQPDGWVLFQAIRLEIVDLINDIRDIGNVFKRDL